MTRVFVVILAYNEAPNIEALIADLNMAFRGKPYEYRYVVVDDGSTDDTADIVVELSKMFPIDLQRHETNMGVGRAFETGLRRAVELASAGDVIVTMEGDRTNRPETLIEMLGAMEKGLDVVCASRYQSGGKYVGFPWKRHFLSIGANLTMRILFPIRGVRDYTIFFRAYRAGKMAQLIRNFGPCFIDSRGFTANAEILIKMALSQQVQCGEVAMVYRYDLKRGKSKMRILRNIHEYSGMICSLLPRRLHPNRIE